MGTFDWNNDGKQDWHDDALFHTVINKDSDSDDGDEGAFPTLSRGTSSYSRSRNSNNSTPQRSSDTSSGGDRLLMYVILILLGACLSTFLQGHFVAAGILFLFGALIIGIICFLAG